MEHVSLGRTLPFLLLKLELWRCWRKHCGCFFAGHFVEQDEGDGLCCRPAFETDNRYCRVDRSYAGFATNSFEVLGEVFPDIIPLRLKQFWNRWPGFLPCEPITTAGGVDVTTIADSRPFARRRLVSHSSICVHITHCYHSSVECEVIICFGAVFYVHVFIRGSLQRSVQ